MCFQFSLDYHVSKHRIEFVDLVMFAIPPEHSFPCQTFFNFCSCHTAEGPNRCYQKHQPCQTTFSSCRTFRTRLPRWCCRCSSASIQVSKRLGWSKQSQGSPLWSTETRCSRQWRCKGFRVSRSHRILCSSHMPRSRQVFFPPIWGVLTIVCSREACCPLWA